MGHCEMLTGLRARGGGAEGKEGRDMQDGGGMGQGSGVHATGQSLTPVLLVMRPWGGPGSLHSARP